MKFFSNSFSTNFSSETDGFLDEFALAQGYGDGVTGLSAGFSGIPINGMEGEGEFLKF